MNGPVRPYVGYVYAVGPFSPDWRWQRAAEVAAGDPHAGLFADDECTLKAVRLLAGSTDPDLSDVRVARKVYAMGGLPRRTVEALLLTNLSEEEVGGRVGLCKAAVRAFHDLFFSVRGNDQLTRLVRFSAEQADDPLIRAAWYGPIAIQAQVAIETGVGAADLPPGLAEGFERKAIMDRLCESDPAAYLRAVSRIRQIDAGLSPGLLQTGQRYLRRAGAGGDEG